MLNRNPIPVLLLLAMAYFAHTDGAHADEAQRRKQGESIYRQQCAECHGATGQGVKTAHAEPLIGDMTVAELTKVIHETMPEEKPSQCVGDDARDVASYIHHAFYSEAARLRTRPPRIGLTRLTASQLRQSLADLARRFGRGGEPTGNGLQAIYYDGSRPRNNKKKIERVDARIKFDFGDKGPGSGINAEDFFIRWRGGLQADVTGKYEITIRCSCAFIANLGAFDREFINNRVAIG